MTKKFRILMLSWEYPPHITGGLAVAVAGMARALAARGNHITLFVPELRGDETPVANIELIDVQGAFKRLSQKEQDELTRYAATRREGLPVLVYASADYREMGSNTAGPGRESSHDVPAVRIKGGYGPSIQADVRVYAQLAGMLAKNLRIDVVHAHDWVTFPAGQAAAASAKVPLVCHIHATEFDRSGSAINQAVYDIEREGMHAAQMVVAVSRFTAGIVRERYGVPDSKVRVAHNSVEEGGIRTVAEATRKYHTKSREVRPKKTTVADYMEELELHIRTNSLSTESPSSPKAKARRRSFFGFGKMEKN